MFSNIVKASIISGGALITSNVLCYDSERKWVVTDKNDVIEYEEYNSSYYSTRHSQIIRVFKGLDDPIFNKYKYKYEYNKRYFYNIHNSIKDELDIIKYFKNKSKLYEYTTSWFSGTRLKCYSLKEQDGIFDSDDFDNNTKYRFMILQDYTKLKDIPQTFDLCDLAVSMNRKAIKLIKDEKMKLKVLYTWPGTLEFYNNQTEEICRKVLEKCPECLQYVENQTKKLCEDIVIKYAKVQTTKMCIHAIMDNPSNICHVKDPTLKLCTYAVKKDPSLFIKIPTKYQTDELATLYIKSHGNNLHSNLKTKINKDFHDYFIFS